MRLTTFLALIIGARLVIAAPPTNDQLQAALAHAIEAWQVSVDSPLHIELYAPNACRSQSEQEAANTHVLEKTSYILTEAGRQDTGKSYEYVILINQNCAWGTKGFSLDAMMRHEYGHVLLGATYHNPDPRSVMYWHVGGKQSILPADAARVKRATR